jgi:RNA polymerase-binding transcription factor DksA
MSAKHPTKKTVPHPSHQAGAAQRTSHPAPAKSATGKGKPTAKLPAKPVKTAAGAPKISVKETPTKAAKAAPKVTPSAAKTTKPAPKAAKPAPKPAAKPAPKAAKPAPKAAPKPAPKAAKPAPKAAKPAPQAAKPAPRAAKPAPQAAKPAPQPAKPAPKPAQPVAKAVIPAAAPANHSAHHAKEKVPNHVAKPELNHDTADHAPKKPVQPRRSSLVDFPVPPPPVRPPFVPPKPPVVPVDEAAPTGTNASHNPAFIQKQRARLLDLRDNLVDALSGMTRDTIRNAPEGSEASGSGMHQGDAGSDAYDRDFALSVLAKEQDALYEIDQALRRIQKGNYGVCEISNRKIPQARLEAIPFARLTVECQAQWEKEYGNRRFRPSNEVGFSGGNLIEDEDSETVLLDEEEE